MIASMLVFADEAQPAAPPGPAGGTPAGGAGAQSPLSFLMPMMVVMLLGFLLLRPRGNKQLNDALAKLKAGDRVVTSSGMIGVVTKVAKDGEQEVVTIRFEDGNARVQVLKYAITQVLPDKDAAKDKDASAGK